MLKPVAFPCYTLFTHHLVYVNGVKHKLLHLASVWLVCFLLSERNHLYLYRYVTKSKGYKICEKASTLPPVTEPKKMKRLKNHQMLIL